MGVTDPTSPQFKGGPHGWDLTQWRKLAMVWGYTDRLVFATSETSTGEATTEVDGFTVAEGYVYVITGVAVHHDDTAARVVTVACNVGGSMYYFKGFGSSAQNVWHSDVVHGIFKEDDKITASCTGLVSGKSIMIRGVGYKMAIAE